MALSVTGEGYGPLHTRGSLPHNFLPVGLCTTLHRKTKSHWIQWCQNICPESCCQHISISGLKGGDRTSFVDSTKVCSLRKKIKQKEGNRISDQRFYWTRFMFSCISIKVNSCWERSILFCYFDQFVSACLSRTSGLQSPFGQAWKAENKPSTSQLLVAWVCGPDAGSGWTGGNPDHHILAVKKNQ